jgi:hypothetical protein
VSPSLEERRAWWREWTSTHETFFEGYVLAGFEHWCGGGGTMFSDDVEPNSCGACHCEVRDPREECVPLYKKEPE